MHPGEWWRQVATCSEPMDLWEPHLEQAPLPILFFSPQTGNPEKSGVLEESYGLITLSPRIEIKPVLYQNYSFGHTNTVWKNIQETLHCD